jgi:long-chain acyl-CoA synthetase
LAKAQAPFEALLLAMVRNFYTFPRLHELKLVKGALEVECLDIARIAFSIPIVNTYVHPLVAGPIFASHPLDLQYFPAAASPTRHLTHVGPPSVNVEAKLVGVDDQAIEDGADPIGVLSVRGPPVGKLSGVNEGVDEQEQWVEIGTKAKALRNGTFKILT